MAVSHLTRSKATVISTGDVVIPVSHHPLISVILPCYNVERTLRRCLDSVISQDYRPLEIVCVNDGSTDSTIDILQYYHNKYDADTSIGRSFTIIDRENGGYGSAMNEAIRISRGSYIAILETDDWIEPSFYSTLMDYRYRIGVDADIIKTPYNRMIRDVNGNLTPMACSYKSRIPMNVSLRLRDTPEFILHHPSIWSALYKKSFLKSNKILFREEPGAGWTDNPFLYETMLLANSIIYYDHAFYNYVEDDRQEEKEHYRNNPEVPSNRFCDNDDIMRRLANESNSSEETWMAHTKRGFNYIDYIMNGSDKCEYDGENAWKRIDRIVSRINPVLVLENEELSSSQKKMYFERKEKLEGIDGLEGKPLFIRNHEKRRFIMYLIRQGIYRLMHTSISFTIKSTLDYMKRKGLSDSDNANDKHC